MRIGDWSSDVCSSDLFSSGARSIWSYAVNFAPPASASTFVIAAVRDVLPWSTWPIVPMLQCGFVRSNFAFAIFVLRTRSSVASSRVSRELGADFLAHRLGHAGVVVEMHRELGPALRRRAQVVHVAEHVGERHHRLDHLRVAAHLGADDLAPPGAQVA